MTRHLQSLGPEYFEQMFCATDDPWNLETSSYEGAKYDRSIRALGKRAYDRGVEIGCAKGVLTQRLAQHCAALLAVDISTTALDAARVRCAALPQVSFAQMAFPAQTPAGERFDLIVLSEVVYYWDDADIARAADCIGEQAAPGGDILLVHWTGETDYPQTGDGAVSKLRAALPRAITDLVSERCSQYRLDVWRLP